MAIIDARMKQKRGLLAQLDKDKLLPGEFAIPEDSDKIYICIKAGVVLEIPSTQSIREILDTLNEVVEQGTQMIDDFERLEVEKLAIDDNNVSTLTAYSSDKIIKLIDEADSAENTVTFESFDDEDNLTWTDVPALSSGEKHKSIFSKISTMFKNVRYLFKLIGTTDISGIEGGTVTNAIAQLNLHLNNIKSGLLAIDGVTSSSKEFSVAFDKAMVDTNYALAFSVSYASYFNSIFIGVSSKSVTGFKIRVGSTTSTDISANTYIIQWTAVPF